MSDDNVATPEFVAQVRAALDYNPETGEFRWKHRSDVPPQWNGKWAGKIAGKRTNAGYRAIAIKRTRHLAHRLGWLIVHGKWPEWLLDHRNGDRLDNRLANLREATQSQNLSNRGKNKNNTSGFKGVSFDKRVGGWRANIMANGKQTHLGTFHTPEVAHAAYCKAVGDYHGAFARAN